MLGYQIRPTLVDENGEVGDRGTDRGATGSRRVCRVEEVGGELVMPVNDQDPDTIPRRRFNSHPYPGPGS